MLLRNLYSLPEGKLITLQVTDGIIKTVSDAKDISPDLPAQKNLSFENAMIFPGLINSHDHLDFNLFPRLGNRIYNNYGEWGIDIHEKNKDAINAVLKVPKPLRVQWGIYKNLLSGVTTVVNHGVKLEIENEWINVFQNCHSLHSVLFEKNWRIKLNNPFAKKQAFAIHVGEGTDETSAKEIDELIKWNLFKRDLIGIHAVAMNKKQAGNFKAIVWCPDSNYFLVGQTSTIKELKLNTKIIFGTDSTLSAGWNIWDHLRKARDEKMMSDLELFATLNLTPAEVWPMPLTGKIAPGYQADLVIARRKSNLTSMDAFYAVNPEEILMVIHKGQVNLFDAELRPQLTETGFSMENFFKITLNRQIKYVRGNLPELIRSIRHYYPEADLPIS